MESLSIENHVTLDIENEAELILRIEHQLENFYDNPILVDYLEFYARRFVGVPDYEPISKLEEYIDNEEEKDRFISLMESLKFLYIRHLGINCFNSNDEDYPDFDFMYSIYYTFVLNTNRILAYYLLGLNSEANDKFENKEEFTLRKCAEDIIRKNRMDIVGMESMSREAINSLLSVESELNKDDDNKVTLEHIISLSDTFKSLYRKVFFTERFFIEADNLIDFWFNLILQNDENELFKTAYYKFLSFDYSVEIDIFIDKIQNFLLQESNMDKIEEIYRKRLEIMKN